MLILTRKTHEAIVIDNDVIVHVLEIKGGQVKLGVEAPDRVRVHREEIYKAILEENIRAGLDVPVDLSSLASLQREEWPAGSKLVGKVLDSGEKEKNDG